MQADAAPTIRGIHHTAFRCRDAEETRAFYQDLLGLPMRVALRIDKRPGTDDPLEYLHLFFEMGDGNFIAFFNLPEHIRDDQFEPIWSFDMHLAFELESPAEQQRFLRRLEDAGVAVRGPIDHGFVTSIYFYDPNGVQLEFTVRAAAHDAIVAEEAGRAPAILADWERQTAAIKRQKLGIEPAVAAE